MTFIREERVLVQNKINHMVDDVVCSSNVLKQCSSDENYLDCLWAQIACCRTLDIMDKKLPQIEKELEKAKKDYTEVVDIETKTTEEVDSCVTGVNSFGVLSYLF